MVYVRSTRVYKQGDFFFKKYQKFIGHLRPTIIDSWRTFAASWHFKYAECPQKPRKYFADDYRTFKDYWGMQDIYLQCVDGYDRDTDVGQVQIVCPVYQIDNGRIKKIYNRYRGIYPASIFDLKQVEEFPRESKEITPDEKYADCSGINGRNSNIFVALRGYQCTNDVLNVEDEYINMTGTGHYVPGTYHPGYDYIDGQLIEHQQDDTNN